MLPLSPLPLPSLLPLSLLPSSLSEDEALEEEEQWACAFNEAWNLKAGMDGHAPVMAMMRLRTHGRQSSDS